MRTGFMLNWRWVFPVKGYYFTKSSSSSTRQISSSENAVRGRETSYEPTRMSILSIIPEESETLYKDHLKAYTCSYGALEITESSSTGTEGKKTSTKGGSGRMSYGSKDDFSMLVQAEEFARSSISQTSNTSNFGLLMEGLEKVEEVFVDTDFVRLERDILIQIGRLGALELFYACLSRNLSKTETLSLSTGLSELPKNSSRDGAVDNRVGNVIVRSGRKEQRKSKRERAEEKSAKMASLSSTLYRNSRSPRRGTASSNAKSRRLIIARNETEMSQGVKEVANLERIRTTVEEEIGRVASVSIWAEAAGINEKVLQQRLQFGWHCRDRLLKSTRSLVLYLARSYRGLGISIEDLLQAGYIGVLQGAERFDHTRGYRFSTYVQYWIKKSMATLVAQHSKGILIPVALSRAIRQIKKARRTLYNLHGRYPDENELSRFTGLPLTKVRYASQCPRIVGSISEKVGDDMNLKYMEITPDTSIKSPEEMVMKQHVRKDIYKLLDGLPPRERKVLMLRHGLWDGQCKSLQETGKVFNVTREWIRKLEKSALSKIREGDVLQDLSHYYLNF